VGSKKVGAKENYMRRAVNIFYQCAIGFITALLALGIYEKCQGWHIRMLFAEISQPLAVANPDEKEQEKEKADTLAADGRILAVAQQKPFIAIMSADEAAAIKKAKADLGLSQ
jgi:hypothetical protein